MSAATNWEGAYRTQVEAIKELRAENADLRGTLDAVIAADGRAADLWRAAHPGKELVIPDRAKLVGWLLEQNAALLEKLDAARKHSALVVTFLAQAQVELVETRHHLNKSKEEQP
tara:strand:- start:2246 stop:2590 length:345 start_codon:yes stop_codon:yes gene_type:complete